MSIDTNVGIVIENLRKEKNISWDELSKTAGISRNYIFRLRRGVNERRNNRPVNPSLKVMLDIADALEISRKEFLQQCGYIEE